MGRLKKRLLETVQVTFFFFYFFPSLSCLAVLSRFPRQIGNFWGPKFWSKKQKKTFFFKLTNFPFWSIFKRTLKSTFLEKEFFQSFCPYIGSPRCVKMILVIFLRFLNVGPFFGPFLGTLVENSKYKKVAPGNSLNFPKKIKILTLIFGYQNCVFLKCTFSGPQLSWRGLVWYLLNSLKARAPRGRPAGARASRGLDNSYI